MMSFGQLRCLGSDLWLTDRLEYWLPLFNQAVHSVCLREIRKKSRNLFQDKPRAIIPSQKYASVSHSLRGKYRWNRFRARMAASRINPKGGTHSRMPQGRNSECQRCTCVGCLAIRISFQCCSSSDPELFRPRESQPIISRPFLPIPLRRRLYTDRKSVTSPNWNNATFTQSQKKFRISYFNYIYI